MAEQTILIAEDDPDIRDGVRILLSGEGYHIIEAENGTRALEVFRPEVDLVILDIMMPGMSGLHVCEELRKLSTVPILFLTAKSQESDKLLGLTAGGDDYLPKPFSFAELSARVKALLRRYCVYQGKGQAPARAENLTLCSHGVKLALDCNRVWVEGGGDRPDRDGVQDPAAAHAEPPAHLPGTGDLRGCVAGALFLHLQRHRDGTYPQSADEDRKRPAEPRPSADHVGERVSLCARGGEGSCVKSWGFPASWC